MRFIIFKYVLESYKIKRSLFWDGLLRIILEIDGMDVGLVVVIVDDSVF